MHQGVGFTGFGLCKAPVHWQKHRAAANSIRQRDAGGQGSAPGCDRGQSVVFDAVDLGILGMHFQAWLRMHVVESLHHACAGHGVPLAEVTAHGEYQWVNITGWFG